MKFSLLLKVFLIVLAPLFLIFSGRVELYKELNGYFEKLEDGELVELLSTSKQTLDEGWGKTYVLEVNSTKVFIKEIPLTQREFDQKLSTKNIYKLPLFYQYGVGSAGFGVWRELKSLLKANEWVIEGECKNFPLTYHWRVLPRDSHEKKEFNLEKYHKYWGGSDEIKTFMQDRLVAPYRVIVIMEYIPYTVDDFINKKIKDQDFINGNYVFEMYKKINKICEFMKANGMIHFDAHTRNILTDGTEIYFADFGLASSRDFELSEDEKVFFEKHTEYDKYLSLYTLISSILYVLNPKIYDPKHLLEVVSKYTPSDKIKEFVIQHFEFFKAFVFFRKDLKTKIKKTSYPKETFESLFEL